MPCLDLGECSGCEIQGRCCHFRVELSGRLFVTEVPCPFLSLETRLCKRYETRLEVPWCNEAGSISQLPGCRPYYDPLSRPVEEFEGTPEISEEMGRQVLEAIRQKIPGSNSLG